MIKEKSVYVKISGTNYNKYYNKYGPFNNRDVIEIDINDLTKKSAITITAICDKCKIENTIKYCNYTLQIERGGYYCCHRCSRDKVIKTNLDKYGVECTLENKEIKAKSKKTLILKYGVDNISKLESIKNDRSGNFNTINFKQKSKQTWLLKYGVDNPSKCQQIKDKKENTLIENYGVSNPSHSAEIFEKAQTTGKKIKMHEIGLMYRGTYEKHFLDYCLINNILVEKGPTIQYIFNGKKKYYHSDFYIPKFNLICEIKSSYYYYLYLEKNLLKMDSTKNKGYNFIFIINKNYKSLKVIINKKED